MLKARPVYVIMKARLLMEKRIVGMDCKTRLLLEGSLYKIGKPARKITEVKRLDK